MPFTSYRKYLNIREATNLFKIIQTQRDLPLLVVSSILLPETSRSRRDIRPRFFRSMKFFSLSLFILRVSSRNIMFARKVVHTAAHNNTRMRDAIVSLPLILKTTPSRDACRVKFETNFAMFFFIVALLICLRSDCA